MTDTTVRCGHRRRHLYLLPSLRRRGPTCGLLLLAALLLQGCAPVFSDFQSARMVAPGRLEVTPAATYVSTPQHTVGVQVGYGLHRRVELRARLTHVFVRWEPAPQGAGGVLDDFLDAFTQDFDVFSAGPKVGLIEDRLALHLPVEAYFNGDVGLGGLQGHPALVLSVPAAAHVEVNPSINAILPAGFVAVNLGVAAGALGRWAVRPEVGVLLNGPLFSVGIGFSYRPGRSSTDP